MYSIKTGFITLMTLMTVACGGITDDLRPSGADKQGDTTNASPATVENLSLTTIDGTVVDVASLLATHDGVVFYFTMWCPVCDSHMSHIRSHQVQRFPNVAYVLVDYVSSSVAEAKRAAGSAGFAGAPFSVVVDTDGRVEAEFNATMGTTVVVGPGMTILQNEDYKDGVKLTDTLSGL